MRTRTLRFGLYADQQGLAWVREVVVAAVGSRSARIVGESVVRTFSGSELTTADVYDLLAEQWAVEHPGRSSGAREPVELRVHLVCSLRTWRAIRKTVIKALCPEGTAPHVCRVPWMAA
ncbi:hypothetical protein [Streptomyces rapamycinicus]|uniref:Uncharacterized protein n=2 Tax=Streptomyces rapamycinicus TaxID=1226757 RepID=A0A0A0NUI6_STRRN|nr:hypothetical protein [Streptomyces rapamycinicus]AGP61054.1 hypothetical protein M271_48460 [Streptomyces rapamycinicus NRRL 5491]MBB4787769.1 hypothetical protein [Streptomyces rapamycinicus]RLV72108.1 hypothetical protein D3C57_146315 [Streptomyces rapamycinicus NRRL 5491]UTP36573.1 hypothetical protein LIV37_49220 [Streptomyces rapamycinicus NRRL 5491]